MRDAGWVLCGRVALTLLALTTGGLAQVTTGTSDCALPARIAATRPEPQGPPTTVTVAFYLIDLHAVHDADETFVADLAGTTRWQDPRLAKFEGCHFELSQVWTPLLRIVNRRSLERQEQDVVQVGANGEVSYFQRGYGEFTVGLDLRDFPFDTQTLTMQAVSRRPPSDVQIVVDQETTGQHPGLTLIGWTLGQLSSGAGTMQMGPVDLILPSVNFSIQVRRQTSFFIWKLILPLSLVVMMSWAVFWIDPNIVPARLGLSATAILTIFAYQFAFSNLLPRLPYLTRMDFFFLGCFGLVFLGLVETVATIGLHRDKSSLALAINYYSRWAFPLGLLIILLISFVL